MNGIFMDEKKKKKNPKILKKKICHVWQAWICDELVLS